MIKNCLVFSVIFIFLVACKGTTAKDNGSDDASVSSGSEQSQISHKTKIANPAAARCVDDGYQLEPVVENGVSVDSLCVNPETGLKCEVWKYFRNECSLKN